MADRTHRARGAGRWYPGDRRSLAAMIEDCLERARISPFDGRIAAAIAPHAGYVYSGPVAGHVYRALRDRAAEGQAPDTVVVLGFSHRAAFPGVALLDGGAIETPLGRAALDPDSAARLVDCSPRLFFGPDRHGDEHSAENQIPFLQTVLPGSKLIVALMGDREPDTVCDCANALIALAAERNTLVVASTDLLHDPDYDRVARADSETLDRMAAMDEAGLAKRWSYEEQICCGLAPVQTALRFAAAQGAKRGLILGYRNSGDDHPESRGQWVVGYGAVVYPV